MRSKNLLTGFDNLNNANNAEWRVSLQGEISERITVFATYDGVDETSNGRVATPIGTVPAINFTTAVATQLGFIAPSTQLPAAGSLGEYETTGLIANGRDSTRVDRVSGAVTWRLADHMTFNLLGGYQKLRNKSTTDQDGTPAPIANASMPNHQQQRYYEGRLSGELLDSRVEWILGANFFNEQGAIEVLTNPERSTTRSDSLSFVQNQSYAGFAHLSFDVTDRFSVAGGIRQTYDSRKIQTAVYRGATNSIATCGVNPALRTPGGCEARARAKFDYVAWEGTANYRVTDDVMVYARAAKGQKSGGFNASVQTGFLNPFNPETLLQYEVGLKSELFDRRVRLDIAAYSGDYKQIQRQVIRIIRGAPSVFVSNAAAATVKGAEAELTVAPAEGLQLRAGVGYTDAEYDAWNFVDPITGARENLSRNRFALVPKYTYRLAAQYSRDLGSATVHASANWNGTSKYWLSPENRPDFVQEGYGLLSARLAIEIHDEDWEFAVFGNNLTDKYYQTFGSVYGLPAGALLVPVSGQPRMVGASVTYRFR
jgi:iron complex outermembrane recepter protein